MSVALGETVLASHGCMWTSPAIFCPASFIEPESSGKILVIRFRACGERDQAVQVVDVRHDIPAIDVLVAQSDDPLLSVLPVLFQYPECLIEDRARYQELVVPALPALLLRLNWLCSLLFYECAPELVEEENPSVAMAAPATSGAR